MNLTASFPTPRPALRELRDDDRGAVMMMGICMALFLIGAMWTVAGIGDAVVYRDQLQETADHVAFSSAAVHARGMNLIAALNLIMFAATAMHIVMGLITLLLNAISLVPFPPVAGPARGLATGAFQIWDKYYRFQKPVQNGVGMGSKVASFAYPYLGATAGVLTGADYGEVGLSMSASMIPGPALNGLVNATGVNAGLSNLLGSTGAVPGARTGTMSPVGSSNGAPQVADDRLALPVKEENMGYSCYLVASYTLDWIRSWSIVQAARDFNIFGWHPLRGLIDGAVNPISGFIRDIFCNDGTLLNNDPTSFIGRLFGKLGGADRENPDGNGTDENGNPRTPPAGTVDPEDPNRPPPPDGQAGAGAGGGLLPPMGVITLDPFWGTKGPKAMWGGAKNGNDWMQVWGWAIGGSDRDQSTRRIKMAQQDYTGGDETVDYPAFNAQAEFYYDCDTTWSAESCNDTIQTRATYNMKWRARLRRVKSPSIGGMLQTFGVQSILNSSLLNYIRGGVNNNGAVVRLEQRLGAAGPLALRATLGGANGARGQLGAAASAVQGQLRGSVNPSTDSFH